MKKINRVFEGFTLAELLMSVLVISIIMVALAPVITKRVLDNITVNLSKNNGKLFLYTDGEPECVAATDGQKSVDCTFTPPQGVNKVSVVLVSGGGGGAGATNPNITYDTTETLSSTTRTNFKKIYTITDSMKKVVINYMTGGGGGGSAGAFNEANDGTITEAECNKYNAIRIAAEDNGTDKDLCVTKFNAGDPGGPAIDTSYGITRVPTSTIECKSPNACCWVGDTADNCSAGSYGYSGCTRTVCNFIAAQTICSTFHPDGTTGWRLPNSTELQSWSLAYYTVLETMQLCSVNPHTTGAACGDNYTNCLGAHMATQNHCYPARIWGSTQDAGSYTNNLTYISMTNPNDAQSVRCVYERTKPTYKANAGGGGGGSPVIKNYTIPENILSENIDGRIEITSGAGGAGAQITNSANTNSAAGGNGNTTEVLIYGTDNTIKWGLRVYGAYGGKATKYIDPTSNGADARPIQSCQLYNGTAWENTNCTIAGTAGYKGQTYDEESDEPAGGNGGECKYDSNSGNGGVGGVGANPQGGVGAGYGAGGGGGTIYITYEDGGQYLHKGKGGDGANGVVDITITRISQAAGGGAGGGGAFARVIDLDVVPGQNYPVRVGGGGAGGAQNTPGENGGQTFIQIGGTKYELEGGKGGQIGTPEIGGAPAIHGLGGAGALISSSLSSIAEEFFNGGSGTDGADVEDELIETRIIGSSGGCGGESGIASPGAAGGMNICTEGASINGIDATVLDFQQPGNVFSQAQYGTAGSGGGGGGWDKRGNSYSQLGVGSKGLDGYVYVFWSNSD